MSFREMLRVLRRRWYAAALVLVVTGGLSLPVYHPKAEYQASVVLVLIPPAQPGQPNALAAATPSVAATGLAVDFILQSDAGTAALRRDGVTDAFTVAPRNSGTEETPAYTVPSELLTVTGASPADALSETATLAKAFDSSLRTLQESVGVEVRSLINAATLTPPAVAELRGSKSRGLAGMAFLGIGFSIWAALWLDRRLDRRRARLLEPGTSDQGERVPSPSGLFSRRLRLARSHSE